MEEIELKLQVPASSRAAVDAAVAGRARAPRQRLRAVYFDTAERALARSGMALRIRHEGRRRIQTLKAAGDDGITRFEHEVALADPPAEDALADPALHAGTPAGDRLLKLLHKAGSPALVALYRTDILRRSRRLRTPLGVVELSFDQGAVIAGDERAPVSELEIELVSGSAGAVVATARGWALRHGLWLDTRSKAERGDLLARGEAMAPHRTASPVALSESMSLAQGRRAVLLSCLEQVSVNGSQVASGCYGDEHVHQLRIGLRRLRTALRLFGDGAPAGDIGLRAAELFRHLGAARDRAAVAQPLEQALNAALAEMGLPLRAPPLPAGEAQVEPAQLMRLAPAQSLLLDLLALTQAPAAAAEQAQAGSLRQRLVQHIRRWHGTVRTDARRFAALDDTARHTLRKRAKSLRYGIEFAAGLFNRREVKRYLKPLRRLQECLGEITDTTVALDAYRSLGECDPPAAFALGWLAACKQALLRKSGRPVAAFLKARPFWRG